MIQPIKNDLLAIRDDLQSLATTLEGGASQSLERHAKALEEATLELWKVQILIDQARRCPVEAGRDALLGVVEPEDDR
jgi:hypothetical protein